MPKPKTPHATPEDLLRAAGIAFDRIEDVPPKVIREVQRRAFANMRSIELPPAIIRQSLDASLLRELLVTRVGFSGVTAGHYIPRPEGSLDCIFIHCVQGQGWLQMDGKQWTVAPGMVLCIPAGKPHSYGADRQDPWSIYWLHLTGRLADDYLHFVLAGRDRPCLFLPHLPEVLAAFESIWSAMKSVHTWENLVQASIRATAYLGHVRRQQESEHPRGRASEDAVRQSIAHMAAHLYDQASLGDLAKLAGMSVTRYTAAFRKATGCSPREYFNRLKVQRACELLRAGDRTIREIAAELGFDDPYYFSHAFKRITGLSPQKFRNK